MLALTALAVAAALAGGWRFKRYVDEDPRLCATCHQSSPEFALWMRGTHKTVACQRCHHARPDEGVAMLGAFLLGKAPAGHGGVQIGSCAECHFSHDPRWPQVGGSRGHRIHYEEHKIACVRCHAASMHGFEPIAARCADCHPGHAVRVHGMEGMHCFACHEFLGDEPGLRPARRDRLRCHTAQGIHAPMNEHGAPMAMACAPATGRTRRRGRRSSPARAATTRRRPRARGCTGTPATAVPRLPPGAHLDGGAGELPPLPRARPAHAQAKACTECHSFAGVPRPPRPDEGTP